MIWCPYPYPPHTRPHPNFLARKFGCGPGGGGYEDVEPTDQPCTEPDLTGFDLTGVEVVDGEFAFGGVAADDLAGVDVTVWVPWAKELTDILDAVRHVGASHNHAATGETTGQPTGESTGDLSGCGSSRRTEMVELGVRARGLLDRIGCQPSLPGVFGRAVDVLRAPTNVDPVRISEALERLVSLAVLLQPDPSPGPTIVQQRGGSTRHDRRGQESLPGLEPHPALETQPALEAQSTK